MGQVSWIKAIIACLVLLGASVLTHHLKSQSYVLEYPVPLDSSQLVSLPWQSGKKISIENKVVEALKLDDYLYRQFLSDLAEVDLYIGFYHSGDKIGAAHHPLVCFQGQGWVISESSKGVIPVGASGEYQINYSAMVANNDGQKMFIFYWFQSFDSTEDNTLQQKIAMILNKLAGRGTSNAFVRITTRINKNESVTDAFNRSVSFTRSFYPGFYAYVTHAEH